MTTCRGLHASGADETQLVKPSWTKSKTPINISPDPGSSPPVRRKQNSVKIPSEGGNTSVGLKRRREGENSTDLSSSKKQKGKGIAIPSFHPNRLLPMSRPFEYVSHTVVLLSSLTLK